MLISFTIVMLGISVVVVVLGDASKDSAAIAPAVAIIATIGLVSLAMQVFILPKLDCTSSKPLATSYRVRFFLRLALSEVVALAACAISISIGPRWVFFVGAAFTQVGFWQLAPTRRHLQQDQDRLSLSACQLSLIAALRTPST